MNILRLLQTFCSKEPGSHVADPFSAGDHVYFTDRVVMLRVPNRDRRIKPDESHVSAPVAIQLFENAITVARFDSPPALPKPDFQPCDQCLGTGSKQGIKACLRCEGKGRVRVAVPVVWHDWLVSDIYIERLRKLPEFALAVPMVKAGKLDPVPFRFNFVGTRDGHGLLMPMRHNPKTSPAASKN
ncbi:MAG: hypothetical protein IT581_20140 [Verrucomicrobiales bacterium]|nr:hypothetical protein [Verrucomicrobiales bacterium]